MQAKIKCEVICCHCGGVSSASRYYKNPDTIKFIKKATANWIYSKEYGGNLCPVCQEELGIKKRSNG